MSNLKPINFDKLIADNDYYVKVRSILREDALLKDSLTEDQKQKFDQARHHWVMELSKNSQRKDTSHLPDPPPFGIRAVVNDILSVFR